MPDPQFYVQVNFGTTQLFTGGSPGPNATTSKPTFATNGIIGDAVINADGTFDVHIANQGITDLVVTGFCQFIGNTGSWKKNWLLELPASSGGLAFAGSTGLKKGKAA